MSVDVFAVVGVGAAASAVRFPPLLLSCPQTSKPVLFDGPPYCGGVNTVFPCMKHFDACDVSSSFFSGCIFLCLNCIYWIDGGVMGWVRKNVVPVLLCGAESWRYTGYSRLPKKWFSNAEACDGDRFHESRVVSVRGY